MKLDTFAKRNIHFVGIKGTGMAALVEILASEGAIITGSDVPDVFYTDAILARLGIKPFTTFSASNITDKTELVIYSSAYNPTKNQDLIEAKKRGIPTMLYTDALGEISKTRFSVGICGVHGKTTTTGIAGTILKALNLPVTVLAGSAISSFDGHCTHIGGNKFFVAETCEYQRHFLSFHPNIILLTNVESDHEDYYPTYEDILKAFVEYGERLEKNGKIIYCIDDNGARDAVCHIKALRPDIKFIAYGFSVGADYHVKLGTIIDEKQHFTLNVKGASVQIDNVGAGTGAQNTPLAEFALKIPGVHTVLDSVGAIALAVELLKQNACADGASECANADASADNGAQNNFYAKNLPLLQQGLLNFTGAKRRTELIGTFKGALVMDDYAHHPTAIKTTLAGLKAFYPNKRLVVDFMSHTYTRTAALLDDFASAFTDADEVILHKIYPSAREQYNGTVTGELLYQKTKLHHKNVHYFEEVMDALDFVQTTLCENDLFITLGAGDNWKLGAHLTSLKV